MKSAPIESQIAGDDGQTRTIRLSESAPMSHCVVAIWDTTLPCPVGFLDLVERAAASNTEEGRWLQENISRAQATHRFVVVLLSIVPDGTRCRWRTFGRDAATETIHAIVRGHVEALAASGILMQGPVDFRPVAGAHLVDELCTTMIDVFGPLQQPGVQSHTHH